MSGLSHHISMAEFWENGIGGRGKIRCGLLLCARLADEGVILLIFAFLCLFGFPPWFAALVLGVMGLSGGGVRRRRVFLWRRNIYIFVCGRLFFFWLLTTCKRDSLFRLTQASDHITLTPLVFV